MGEVQIRLQNINSDGDSTIPREAAQDSIQDTIQDTQEPDDDTLVAAMESILFAMGEAVPIESIAQALCVVQGADPAGG